MQRSMCSVQLLTPFDLPTGARSMTRSLVMIRGRQVSNSLWGVSWRKRMSAEASAPQRLRSDRWREAELLTYEDDVQELALHVQPPKGCAITQESSTASL